MFFLEHSVVTSVNKVLGGYVIYRVCLCVHVSISKFTAQVISQLCWNLMLRLAIPVRRND